MPFVMILYIEKNAFNENDRSDISSGKILILGGKEIRLQVSQSPKVLSVHDEDLLREECLFTKSAEALAGSNDETPV